MLESICITIETNRKTNLNLRVNVDQFELNVVFVCFWRISIWNGTAHHRRHLCDLLSFSFPEVSKSVTTNFKPINGICFLKIVYCVDVHDMVFFLSRTYRAFARFFIFLFVIFFANRQHGHSYESIHAEKAYTLYTHTASRSTSLTMCIIRRRKKLVCTFSSYQHSVGWFGCFVLLFVCT